MTTPEGSSQLYIELPYSPVLTPETNTLVEGVWDGTFPTLELAAVAMEVEHADRLADEIRYQLRSGGTIYLYWQDGEGSIEAPVMAFFRSKDPAGNPGHKFKFWLGFGPVDGELDNDTWEHYHGDGLGWPDPG